MGPATGGSTPGACPSEDSAAGRALRHGAPARRVDVRWPRLPVAARRAFRLNLVYQGFRVLPQVGRWLVCARSRLAPLLRRIGCVDRHLAATPPAAPPRSSVDAR